MVAAGPMLRNRAVPAAPAAGGRESHMASDSRLQAATAAVLDQVERQRPEHLALLQEFVRIPSPLGQERPAQLWLARQFRHLGLLVDLFDCDPAELAGLPGWTPFAHPYQDRPNLVAVWPGAGGGRSLILNAHVDTTSAEPVELWTRDPWGGEIVGERLYGRGAQDDKAGHIAMLMVVRALQRAGVRLQGTLLLQSVIEDEITGNGTLACMARGYDADGAVVIDGTGLGRAIVAHPGQVAFRITVHGRPMPLGAAHRGVNAIEAAWPLVGALRALEARLNQDLHPQWAHIEHPVNFNLWGIRGGEWLGTVPGRCVLEGALSFLPPWTLPSIRREIEAAVTAAARGHPWLAEHPPAVSYDALGHDPLQLPPDTELLRRLGAAHQAVAGRPLQPHTITGWCDLRHFSLNRPTPCCLFGPGAGGNAHCPDEWLDLREVGPVVGTLAAFVLDWCGVA